MKAHSINRVLGFSVLLVVVSVWVSITHAQTPLKAPSAVFTPPSRVSTKATRPLGPLLPQPVANALTIQLPFLPDYKLQTVGKTSIPLSIGTGQSLPTYFQKSFLGSQLAWTPLTNGGEATTIEITSPNAQALRIEVVASGLPDDAELRFYAPVTPPQSETIVLGKTIPTWQTLLVTDGLG